MWVTSQPSRTAQKVFDSGIQPSRSRTPTAAAARSVLEPSYRTASACHKSAKRHGARLWPALGAGVEPPGLTSQTGSWRGHSPGTGQSRPEATPLRRASRSSRCVATTLGLRGLKPAAPRVDRAAIWIDSVQKGPLVIEVRGPGTLVPERIRYISAVTAGRVERRLAEPGQEVKPETVLLELSNPDVQLEALESERQLTVSQADRVNLHDRSRDRSASIRRPRSRPPRRLISTPSATPRRRRSSWPKQLISAMEASRAHGPGGGAGDPLQGGGGAARRS